MNDELYATGTGRGDFCNVTNRVSRFLTLKKYVKTTKKEEMRIKE